MPTGTRCAVRFTIWRTACTSLRTGSGTSITTHSSGARKAWGGARRGSGPGRWSSPIEAPEVARRRRPAPVGREPAVTADQRWGNRDASPRSGEVPRGGDASVHPLPRQIPRLAALQKSGDTPRRVALEEVAEPGLTRNEEQVGRLEAKGLRRLSRRSAGQTVGLTPDEVGEIAERVAAAVGPALLGGGRERGWIGPQRQDLRGEQLPLAVTSDPGVSHPVAGVDLGAVKRLVLVGDVAGERDIA